MSMQSSHPRLQRLKDVKKPDVKKDLAPSFDRVAKAGPGSCVLHSQKSHIVKGLNGFCQVCSNMFLYFYPEKPGPPKAPVIAVENVDTQPIDVMDAPIPDPTPPRPASFDDIPTKRRKYQKGKMPSGSETKVLGESGSPSSSTRAPTSTGTPSTESTSPPEVALADVSPKPSKPKRRRIKKRSTVDFSEPKAAPEESADEAVDVKALCSRAGVH